MEIIITGLLAFIAYTLWKMQKRNVALVQEKETVDDTKTIDFSEDMTMDEWKEGMLKVMTSYKRRTGKDMPTYEEMLKLDQQEFNTFLWLKSRPDFLKDTISEMAEHEQRTQSATNRFNKSVVDQGLTLSKSNDLNDWKAIDWSKSILGLFDPKRSEEVMDVLIKMDQTAKEIDPEKYKGQATTIETAIAEKAGYDYSIENKTSK